MSGLWGHTVDTPVSFTIIITNSNTEPSKVSSDNLYLFVLVTLNHQLLSLTSVTCPDAGGQLACNKQQDINNKVHIHILYRGCCKNETS